MTEEFGWFSADVELGSRDVPAFPAEPDFGVKCESL
jgi:hypothetical protein